MDSSLHTEKKGTPSGELSIIDGVSHSTGAVPIQIKLCPRCEKLPVHGNGYYCWECRKEKLKNDGKCIKCKKQKDLDSCLYCKECRTPYWKQYAIDNKEKISKRKRQYREDNREKILMQEKKKRNKSEYKEKRNARERKKGQNNPIYKIKNSMRARVWSFLNGKKKSKRTMELVGCSLDFLKAHLEKQFDSNMTWANYGSYWHIDHVRPCKSFNLLDPEEQKKCFHYTNLQPLECKENMRKGAKLIEKYLNKLNTI